MLSSHCVLSGHSHCWLCAPCCSNKLSHLLLSHLACLHTQLAALMAQLKSLMPYMENLVSESREQSTVALPDSLAQLQAQLQTAQAHMAQQQQQQQSQQQVVQQTEETHSSLESWMKQAMAAAMQQGQTEQQAYATVQVCFCDAVVLTLSAPDLASWTCTCSLCFTSVCCDRNRTSQQKRNTHLCLAATAGVRRAKAPVLARSAADGWALTRCTDRVESKWGCLVIRC